MKLQPFSHRPGTPCVVPGSDWVVEPFPALLRVRGGREFALGITGPVREFTVQLDLEKTQVSVWGHAQEGYFRYQIAAGEAGLELRVMRGFALRVGDVVVSPKSSLLLARGSKLAAPRQALERLSLGNFRAQDIDRMRERLDMRELAPMLFALGQKVPVAPLVLAEANLTHLFLARFTGLFVPAREDALHQGIAVNVHGVEPLALLSGAYATIRSWLLDGENILPALPREWEAGKVFGLQTHGGALDIEWRKGRVWRMAFRGAEPPEFVFGKKVSGFRRRSEGPVTHWDRFTGF